MFETNTTTHCYRDAYRIAHEERAKAIRGAVRWIFHRHDA
jgi:hypothetical protein